MRVLPVLHLLSTATLHVTISLFLLQISGFPLKANIIIRQSEAKSDWKRKIQTKFYRQIRVLKSISKIALVIIENGARWLVENFALSRLSVFKMAARFVDVSE